MRIFLLLSTLIFTMQVDAVNLFAGKLDKYAPFDSEYFDNKEIHVWLPEGYSNAKKYAVLYMHDGQHLFDASLTWNGQEWGVDEVASVLQSTGQTKDFIVVGIFNGNVGGRVERHNQYFPQKVFESLPDETQRMLLKRGRNDSLVFNGALQSDNYLKFLVKELKPFIDKQYSVHTDKENTVIAGSSMGGLISMYAISEYPEVFGAAACISTHWLGVAPQDKDLIPPYFFAYMQEHLPDPGSHRLYFDYGTETLDQFYPPLQAKADELLKARGYGSKNWVTKAFPGAAHDEDSWRKRLHIPLLFLLGK
ncbi:MAG: esterase [Alteromonadaceae bacterium]|nr:esterase [Alteromonadaceae bacterium]